MKKNFYDASRKALTSSIYPLYDRTIDLNGVMILVRRVNNAEAARDQYGDLIDDVEYEPDYETRAIFTQDDLYQVGFYNTYVDGSSTDEINSTPELTAKILIKREESLHRGDQILVPVNGTTELYDEDYKRFVVHSVQIKQLGTVYERFALLYNYVGET